MFNSKPKKISSLQNPLVKHLVKLRKDKEYRFLHGSVLVSGFKLIHELAQILPPKRMIITEVENALSAPETYLVSPEILQKILHQPSPEPIAAEFPLPQPHSLTKTFPLLVLDAVSDPGNLGTLMRTALGLGWKGVYFLPNCVDPFHEKAIRASRGALFHLAWRQGSWEELHDLKTQEKLTVYVADMHGKPIQTILPAKKPLLLLSNEAHGVSEFAHAFGEKIAIPLTSNTESLNVATAGAILMFYLMSHA